VKQTVTLDIAGAKYRMTSDADEAHLQRLADMVNHRIGELGPKAARNATPAQLLAVVALGLADDLLTSEGRREQIEGLTREAVSRTLSRIDQRLAAIDASEG
jgi:cell division protein ZapA (FtsZ GTPase activity inhibitor)